MLIADMLRSGMLTRSCRPHMYTLSKRESPGDAIARPEDTCEWSGYFRELSIELNSLLRLVPGTRARIKL
jgi:hypothetical protein